VVVGGELKPAQPLGAQARRQPGDDGADVAALQRLLERPEAVAAGDDAAAVLTTSSLEVEAEARAPSPRASPAGRTPSPAGRPAAPRPAPGRADGSRRRRRAAAAARSGRGAASRRPAARRRARRSRWQRHGCRCGPAGDRARAQDAGFRGHAGRSSRCRSPRRPAARKPESNGASGRRARRSPEARRKKQA
jgi:hypothetical protein